MTQKSFEERKKDFAKVRLRILDILESWQTGKLRNRIHISEAKYQQIFFHELGLTNSEIGTAYLALYNVLPEVDNRTRELFSEGEIIKEEEGYRLVYRLNPTKWNVKANCGSQLP